MDSHKPFLRYGNGSIFEIDPAVHEAAIAEAEAYEKRIKEAVRRYYIELEAGINPPGENVQEMFARLSGNGVDHADG